MALLWRALLHAASANSSNMGSARISCLRPNLRQVVPWWITVRLGNAVDFSLNGFSVRESGCSPESDCFLACRAMSSKHADSAGTVAGRLWSGIRALRKPEKVDLLGPTSDTLGTSWSQWCLGTGSSGDSECWNAWSLRVCIRGACFASTSSKTARSHTSDTISVSKVVYLRGCRGSCGPIHTGLVSTLDVFNGFPTVKRTRGFDIWLCPFCPFCPMSPNATNTSAALGASPPTRRATPPKRPRFTTLPEMGILTAWKAGRKRAVCWVAYPRGCKTAAERQVPSFPRLCKNAAKMQLLLLPAVKLPKGKAIARLLRFSSSTCSSTRPLLP